MLIENSVTRETVRLHRACRVMPNSYPSDGIFNLYWRTIMDSFSCILFLRQLYLDLNICCIINFTLKWQHFLIMKSSVRLLSYRLMSKRLVETDVKTTSRRQKFKLSKFPIPSRVHRNPGRVCKKEWSSTCATGHFLSPVIHMEIPVRNRVCKKK